ncbi:3-oxoacyl-[acyl-carrier-protein] synthase 3 [Tepiditoga spiralis]|uniref:3-oxoacyl-[acyl-carrier-protein] synthase 3 n=1 Tax=Tepiditoga spiralis TaxID=2108365 RepID=A0A7G1GBZ6_9BACT|nr:3-oxoacyl-ACP synthase [Tepiditoga spiralis]BBE31529.1 3-oxoacyl-[acyl-carrier-protein] synthase 3 [Tepiditoga spiralis]
MNIGIIGIGTYIPSTFITSKELSLETDIPEEVILEKFGIIKKPIAGPRDTTTHMAIEAAKKAIKNAGINPKEIDLIIWNGSQHKDYQNWLAGLKVADEIGATNAWSFDMEAMCGSMMAGIDVAKSLMLTHKNIKTVLLVSGYRNNDFINLKEKSTTFMIDLASGGSALIMKKNSNKNLILESSFKGDGSFSEDCIIPVGGSKNWPLQKEDVAKNYFVVKDIEKFKTKLKEKTMSNFFLVIKEALKKSGNLTYKDIDYLAILHLKKSAHDAILNELNLNENQTTYLNNYGHMGQNDQVLSLELGLKERKIKDGDIVVLVGAGIGFVWASTVIKWGKGDVI